MRAAVGVLAVMVALGTAFALEGTNGYTGTQVFTWGDVRGAIVYDAAFGGVEWVDMNTSWLGGGDIGDAGNMAATATGDIYYLVSGSKGAGHTGLIHYDGTNHTQLLHEALRPVPQTGNQLRQVRVSPVTDGRLTSGHPVCLRVGYFVSDPVDLVSVDPLTFAETVVHTFSGFATRFDIADDGTIYALILGDGLHELAWNVSAGGYDDSAVSTSISIDEESDVLVGPDGYLYTFSVSGPAWSYAAKGSRTVYHVDPISGDASAYGQVQGSTYITDWTFDSNGVLWLAMSDTRKRQYVTDVVPGGTTSHRDAISSSSNRPYHLTAGTNGSLFVGENVFLDGGDGNLDAIYEVSPSSGGGSDGGDSGGGGKGGGKGKK